MKSPTGRDVARHSFTYVVGSVVAAAGGALMVPVYTRSLSASDYGFLDTILRLVSMVVSVAFLGVRQAYQRLYFDTQSGTTNRILTSTVVIANIAIAMIVVYPPLALVSLAGLHVGAVELTIGRAALLALWIGFEAVYLVGLSHLQVRMRSVQFVAAQSVRLILLLTLNVLLIRVFHLGLTGALAGNIAASVLSGGVTTAVLIRTAGFGFSGKTFKEVATFGLPYVPTVVFAYVIGNADRLMLIHYGAVTSLGVLALAGKFGELALMVFAGPVDNVWGPYALSVHGDPDGPAKIGVLYTKFIALYVFMALGACLVAPIGVSVLARHEYAFASRLVPIIAVGWVFNVLATLSDIGILIAKNTWLKPVAFCIASLVAMGLQILLIPKYGVIGAATATALSYGVLFAIVRTMGQRAYRMVTRTCDLMIIAAAASASLIGGEYLMWIDGSPWMSLVATSLGVSAYVAALFGMGVIQRTDLTLIVSTIGRRPRPGAGR